MQRDYTTLLNEAIIKYTDYEICAIKRDGIYDIWDYTRFGKELYALATYLHQLYKGKEFRAAVIGANSPEWLIAYHAIIFAGGVTIPIDPNLPSEDIADIIERSKTTLVLCDDSYLPLFRSLKTAQGHSLTRVQIAPICRELLPEESCYKELTKTPITLTEPIDTNPDRVIAQLFTSGTTGKAKGAMLTSENFATICNVGCDVIGFNKDDSILMILPLYHVFGFAVVATGLCNAIGLTLVPELKGPLITEALQDRQLTTLPGVPKMLVLLYDGIERNVKNSSIVVRIIFKLLHFLSATLGPIFGIGFRRKLFGSVHKKFGGNLQRVVSGGASLDQYYFKAYLRMGFTILEGYGLTETFGPISLCPPEKPTLGSVGPIICPNTVMIDKPDKDGVGEVLLRGPSLFKGYLNDEAATKAVFDDEGWFHTGDLGLLDKQENLFLMGRSKDIIILESGKNVYPDEMEAWYAQSELIEEIGVFGIKKAGGEIVGAVIVPNRTLRKSKTADDVYQLILGEFNRLSRNRPNYKRIAEFTLSYDPLPRTSTQKIKKSELKKIYPTLKTGNAHLSVKPTLSALEEQQRKTPLFQDIAHIITSIKKGVKKSEITPKTHLEMDLEYDSLDRLEVSSALEEHFGFPIPNEEAALIDTVGPIISLVESLKKRHDDGELIADAHPIQSLQSIDALHDNRLFSHLVDTTFATLALQCNVDYKGLENIPEIGPMIFASNHQGFIDPLMVLKALPPKRRRRTYALGKEELLTSGPFKKLFQKMNIISVQRGGNISDVLATAKEVLYQGGSILIFPEGTRSLDENFLEFKSGIGMLMLDTHIPVIPVHISGSSIADVRGFKVRFGKKPTITVTLGRPVTTSDLIEQGRIASYAREGEVSLALQKLVEEL